MAFTKTLAEIEAEKQVSSVLDNYLTTSKKGYTSYWSEGERINIKGGEINWVLPESPEPEAPQKEIHWTPDWAMESNVEWSGLQYDIDELQTSYECKWMGKDDCSDVGGKRTTSQPKKEEEKKKADKVSGTLMDVTLDDVLLEFDKENKNKRVYLSQNFVEGKIKKLHEESKYDRAMEILK